MKATSLPHSFLAYRRFLYLKLSLLLVLSALVVYTFWFPADHRGDSVMGYVLGTLSAALMVWLTWFGRRKRRYGTARIPLADWLSAHVYLGGVALPLLAALHCGFHFGWNVHALAYVLMLVCILSGIIGVGIYAAVPAAMTRDRADGKVSELLGRITQIDNECRSLAVGGNLPDAFLREVSAALDASTRKKYVSERTIPLLLSSDPSGIVAAAIIRIREAARREANEPLDVVNNLLERLQRKRVLLRQAHRELRAKLWLRLWLSAHVPLAFAALSTLAVHIFVVFYF